jgi:hypothetical protein
MRPPLGGKEASMKKAVLFVSVVTLFLFAAATTRPALAAEKKEVQKFEKTFPFDENVHKIGITVGEMTLESVQVKNWPDAADFAKAEKDPNDTKTMWVVFTYSNTKASAYKTKFIVSVLDPAGGPPLAVDDATRSQDKNQVSDTNRFGMKLKTRLYKVAKTFKVDFEVVKK